MLQSHDDYRNKDHETVIPPYTTRRSVSSGKRKALVTSNSVVGDLEVDPFQILQELSSAFDLFVRSYKVPCKPLRCSCNCHSDMNDEICDCLYENLGEYDIVKRVVGPVITKIEHYLSQWELESASNAVLCAEALVRGFATQLKIIQMENEHFSDKIITNFPLEQSKAVYEIHKDHFLKNGRELCWRLAVLIVRDDIFYEVRRMIGNFIEQWVVDCHAAFVSYVKQIEYAAFDKSHGVGDSYSIVPLIVAARASEYSRRKDFDGLQGYWISSGIPHVVDDFVRGNRNFFDLIK